MSALKEKLSMSIPDYVCATSLPQASTLAISARALGMTFGPILQDYLSTFGYLGRGSVELYGINERQGLNSDLVKTSLNVQEYQPACEGYAVIDNRGDGEYVLCDAQDQLFVMPDSPRGRPKSLGLRLDDYIIIRLKGQKSVS